MCMCECVCVCVCVCTMNNCALHVHVHVCMSKMCMCMCIITVNSHFICPDQDQAIALACELYTTQLHAMHTQAKPEALGQMPISQRCALQVNYLFFGSSTLEHKIPASTPNVIPCVVIPFQ